MIAEKDIKRLLNAVYYEGSYVRKYRESPDMENEYLGFAPYDDDGFLNICTHKDHVAVYEAIPSCPVNEKLLNMIRSLCPNNKVEAKEDVLEEGTIRLHYILIS